MNLKKFLIFIIFFLILFFTIEKSIFLLKKPCQCEKTVLDKLTLEQKIGQLFIVGIDGKTITPETEDLIKKFHPGGILLLGKNIENKEQLKNLIQELQKISLEDSGLPLFISVDQEGGEISRIDWVEKTPQSEILNQEQAFEIGFQRGRELKELGINLNLAPLLDFCQKGDFLWNRSFQNSSEKIAELGSFLILGQKEAGLLTAVKHFPGYGNISFQPEENLATVSEVPEISQFQTTTVPEMIMLANVIYQEVDTEKPFVFSSNGIKLVKEKLGEEVLIISDDLAQNSLLNKPPTTFGTKVVGGKFSLSDIVTLPIKAGVDVLIFSGWRLSVEQGILEFQRASEKGIISDNRINQAVSRIIKLKEKLLQ